MARSGEKTRGVCLALGFRPIAMALVCAVAAPIVVARFRWGPGQPWRHGENGRP